MSVDKSNLFKVYFQGLIEHNCTVDLELKNNATLSGSLLFVDNNMCLHIQPQQPSLPPQFKGMKTIYLRGSALRMAFLPKIDADLDSLTHLSQ